MDNILEVTGLKIHFDTEEGVTEAVKDFSFTAERGETLAIVGESGSGKSVCALSVTGLLKSSGAVKKGGFVYFNGEEVDYDDEKSLRRLRGGKIAYIFQEPMASLNPLHKIGDQITERIRVSGREKPAASRAKALELLRLCGVKNAESRLNDYPHVFSGGERQRIMIAMALASGPELLIADEPTTALDVTVQAQILDLLEELKRKFGMTVLLITHDMGVVRRYAARAVVARDGRIIESGRVEDIFERPRDEYTRMLTIGYRTEPPKVRQSDEAALEAVNISVVYKGKKSLFGSPRLEKRAVKNVSFTLKKGSSLGVAGESGSGKTSLIKALLGLADHEGEVILRGVSFSSLKGERERLERRHIQAVFQDPYGSLNPRMTAEMIISEGLRAFGMKDRKKTAEAVDRALMETGLRPDMKNRYPHEFSGGQRQRLAIARAVIMRPDVIILDEPTSSLDRQTKIQITGLLNGLREKNGISYIIVTHDLSLISSACDEVIIMKDGAVVEQGPSVQIINSPGAEYTKELVKAAYII